VALSVVIGFLLVYCFRLVIVIILSGIEVSMAMGPGINWLRKHHLPRALSVILIYLALLVPPIIGQASTAISKIAADYQGLKSTLAASSLPVFNQIAALLPAEVNLSGSTGSGTSGSLGSVGQAFSTTGAILNGLLTLFSILDSLPLTCWGVGQ
jgi:predicted PurR-regulated permease PerM